MAFRTPLLIHIAVIGPGRRVHTTFAAASAPLNAALLREVNAAIDGRGRNNKAIAAALGPGWADWIRPESDPDPEIMGPIPSKSGGADEDIIFDDNLDELLSEETDNGGGGGGGSVQTLSWDPASGGNVTKINWSGAPPVQYSPVLIYPEEDTIEVLRQKISLVTRIPIYRQHLFWAEPDASVWSTGFRIAGMTVPPLDRPLVSTNVARMKPVPRVYSYEHLRTVSQSIGGTVFVADLAEYMPGSGFVDAYDMESFYWGFVRLYWPILTAECFAAMVRAEREMPTLYPALALSRASLLSRFAAESAIVRDLKSPDDFARLTINTAITAATATVGEVVGRPISLRDLFDAVEVSNCIPEACALLGGTGGGRHRAYLPMGAPVNGSRAILLRKQYALNESNISFPTGIMLVPAVTIAISLRSRDQMSRHRRSPGNNTSETEQLRYIFLSIYGSGRYAIRSTWAEEELMNFSTLIAVFRRFVNPILESLGRKIGTHFTPVEKTSVEYSAISANIFWKKIIPKSAFRNLRLVIDRWRVAGIFGPNLGFQNSEYKLQFVRGICGYDPMSIDYALAIVSGVNLDNDYMYYSDPTVRNRWLHVYGGCSTTILNRTTDLRIVVSGIREQDFSTFQKYMKLFLWDVEKSLPRNRPTVSSGMSRMRRLREGDPELYNIKKYKSTKNYSQTCQKPRQPILYTADEIAGMSARDHKKLGIVRYWNFTWSRPAYYSCPNMKYPHLSFIVGLHPKGYCMPCCNARVNENAEKRNRIDQVCFARHVWDENSGEGGRAAEPGPEILGHVMHTNRDLDPGRLAHMPSEWLPFFGQEDEKTYLFGVPQRLPSLPDAAMFHSAAILLGMKWPDFTRQLVKNLERGGMTLFLALIDGGLVSHFPDMSSFLTTLATILRGETVYTYSWPRNQWNELAVEMVFFAFDLPIVTLSRPGNLVHLPPLLQSSIFRDETRVGFVAAIGSDIYPIMRIQPEQYARTRVIGTRTFGPQSYPVRNVRQIVEMGLNDRPVCPTRAAITSAGGRVEGSLRNLRGQEYAILVSGLWIPVTPEMGRDNCPITWGAIPAPTIPADRAMEILGRVNVPAISLVRVESIIVGIRIVTGIVRVVNNSETTVSIPAEIAALDPFLVDECIARRDPPAPDGGSRLLARALYDNYSYILLLHEVARILSEERNGEMRAQLLAAGANIPEILVSFPADAAIIRAGQRRGRSLAAIIESIRFSFDCQTFVKIAAGELDPAIVAQSLVEKCTTTGTVPEDLAFPNIYESNGKLILPPSLIRDYAQLLGADLANPIKRREFLALYGGHSLVLDEMDFTQRPMQLITAFAVSD